jgi:hypothetical protein
LEARQFMDEARMMELAQSALSLGTAKIPVPKIYRAVHFPDSPRSKLFWQTLGKEVEVVEIHSSSFQKALPPHSVKRKLAHSLEDSVQFLLDEVLASGEVSSHAIVIEDRPSIRRSVKRAAEQRGLALLDPRDPTFIQASEEIKTALLPLELVAKNFSSSLILSWMNLVCRDAGSLRRKIIECGNLNGLESYQAFPEIYQKLKILKAIFEPRMTVSALKGAVEESLKEVKFSPWVMQTLTQVFE